MTPEQLSDVLVSVLADLRDSGLVDLETVPESVTVERPRSKEHGDYATNVALQYGKRVGMAPRELAGLVAERLAVLRGRDPDSPPGLTKVTRTH